jgi:hypothetical protein
MFRKDDEDRCAIPCASIAAILRKLLEKSEVPIFFFIHVRRISQYDYVRRKHFRRLFVLRSWMQSRLARVTFQSHFHMYSTAMRGCYLIWASRRNKTR